MSRPILPAALLLVALLAPPALGVALDAATVATRGTAATATLDDGVVHPDATNKVLPLDRARQRLQPATAGSYRIELACPEPPLGFFRAPCPLRIVDSDDLLGNPGLAVSPLGTGQMAFASLHGQDATGPSRVSRGNQTHTTFTSTVFGTDWQDNPYFPPSPPGGRDREVLGEDVHALMDENGILYVASLYAYRTEGVDEPWSYTIATWKFDPDLQFLDYTFPLGVFDNRLPGSRIDTMWLVEVPELDRVALLWRERAAANDTLQAAGRNLTGWVAAATTASDPFSGWESVPDDLLVGPCETTTNPVLHGTTIYIGCVIGDGAGPLKGSKPGDVLLYALDLELGRTTVVSKAPVRGGHPMLGVDEQGRMALVTVEAQPGDPGNETRPRTPDRLRAELTTSRLGKAWSDPEEFGERLHDGTFGVKGAWITAMLYRGGTNTLHMVYLEEASDRDRAMGLPLWRKSLVVIDPIGAVLLDLDLHLSDKDEVFFSLDGPNDDDVYGDTRDTLIEVAGREWLAFSDYSVVSVAEILEFDDREDVLVLQQAPPVPEPVPAVHVTTVNVATGVVSGAVAAEALRRLIAARMAEHAGAGRGR